MSSPVPLSGDHVGAFTSHAPLGTYETCLGGPLSGLRLAVKDLFDVQGLVTGAGSPVWAAGRLPADRDARVVEQLRASGAQIVGKTITDELAWSLNGENRHYGTPINIAAPGRVPGGSSSGSAAAVAADLADIGLGTDTGGSVRLPASYTGLWGIRTTHGDLSLRGVVPLAPSYDTVGWMAQTPQILAQVASVLRPDGPKPRFSRLFIATDLFECVAPGYAAPLRHAAQNLAVKLGLDTHPVRLAQDGIDAWRLCFRICQAAEAWAAHGRWVTETSPQFGEDISRRFAMAAGLDAADIKLMQNRRKDIAKRMQDLVADDAAILVPGAGGPPPPRGLTGAKLDQVRDAALSILCPAGHAFLPQIAMPALQTKAGPIGLGLIGPRSSDAALISLVAEMETTTPATSMY